LEFFLPVAFLCRTGDESICGISHLYRKFQNKSPARDIKGQCGAIAFSRTGDPALGDFGDAVILKTVGEVDAGLLAG